MQARGCARHRPFSSHGAQCGGAFVRVLRTTPQSARGRHCGRCKNTHRGLVTESCSSSSAAHASTQQQSAAAQPSRRQLLQLAASALALAPALEQLRLPSASASQLDVVAGPRPLDGAVKAAVDKALAANVEKSKAPVMLRLVFHDAATFDERAGDGGADASVVFELDRPENKGLKRGWRIIEALQQSLKGTAAEGRVSRADLIALAGAHAVAMTGGPAIDVGIGRKDARGAGPEGRLPAEDMAADVQRAAFAAKGISTRDMVALLGAHTLGNKGFGDPVTFDNAYYTALLAKPWAGAAPDSMAQMIGLPSDKVIADDPECKPYIEEYAASQTRFFQDFSAAYRKLASLGAVWT